MPPPGGLVPRSLLVALLGLSIAAPPTAAQLVVRSGSPEATAVAIDPGDRLLGWRPVAESSGPFRPFERWSDAWGLDVDRIPALGPVEIEIERDGRKSRVRTTERPLDLDVAPVLPAAALEALERRTAGGESLDAATLDAIRATFEPLGADALSWALSELGERAAKRREVDLAVTAYRSAAATEPDGFAAELLRRAGDVVARARRADEAEAIYREAVDRWRATEPGGIGESIALSSLANHLGRLHRLKEAEALLRQALVIRGRLVPGSWMEAGVYNNLGILAGRRNDLDAAERHFARTLEVDRAIGRDAHSVLANLGIVARLRGELERAERYTRDAIAGYEAAGDSQRVASKRLNLANIVSDLGRQAEALAIQDRLLEDLPRLGYVDMVPETRFNRALVLRRLGRLDEADADVARAQDELPEERQETPLRGRMTIFRAELDLDRGDLDAAWSFYEDASRLFHRLLPDTSDEARAESVGARILEKRGEPERADALFRRSLDVLERQQERIGGGERGLLAFRSKFAPLYVAYVDFLVARGRVGAAFETHERFRGQALRALLRQRDLDLDAGAPANVVTERAALGEQIEAAYSRLARLDEASADRAVLREEIERLHARRDELSVLVRRDAAAEARAEPPPRPSASELASRLPPGSLALVYDLEAESGRLFTLDDRGSVKVHELGVDAAELETDVARWVDLASAPRESAALRALSARLGATLLGPAADEIAEATRLLVIPDGPLHALAFAALPPPDGVGTERYLVERLPIVRDVSVSVFADAPAAPASPSSTVVVFGDPALSDAATSRFRGDFGRLPSSRVEAAEVGRLFEPRARVFLGEAASETAAREALPGAGLAHFACHAVVDERLPLDSALVLAPDAEGEGLLQAWEIAEQVRLDGALVVLSACETARGGESPGEGIVGLVRALQIAGARTVVASLWRIPDESTTELMRRFYDHVALGEPYDEALRSAQLELLRGPIEVEREGKTIRIDARAPRHWAPFVALGAIR